MSLRIRLAVVCFAICAVPACAREGTPTGPTPTPAVSNFSGNWDGSITFEGVFEVDGRTLTTAVSIVANDADGKITGTWSWRRQSGNGWVNEAVTGIRHADTITLVLPLGSCTATATGNHSNRIVSLRSEGFNSPEGDDLCRTSTVALSLTKQ